MFFPSCGWCCLLWVWLCYQWFCRQTHLWLSHVPLSTKPSNFMLNFHRHNLATNSVFYSGVYARVTNYLNWIQSNIAVRLLGDWGKNLGLTDGYTPDHKKLEPKKLHPSCPPPLWPSDHLTNCALCNPDIAHLLHVLLILGVVDHHGVHSTHLPTN